VLQSSREQLAAKLVPMAALLSDLPSVTLRGPANLDRLKNGVEMGPDDFVTAAPEAPQNIKEAPQRIIVRLLDGEGGLVGLARPGKTPGFLHGWVVLG
jgi:hypothetical protein